MLSASTLASRILGQLRDLILVWKLGASADTDAYLAAFWLPDLLGYFLAGGAFTISFVPAFAKAVKEGRSDDGWRLFSNIATLTATVRRRLSHGCIRPSPLTSRPRPSC